MKDHIPILCDISIFPKFLDQSLNIPTLDLEFGEQYSKKVEENLLYG